MSVFKRWNGTSWETIGPQISSTRFNDISHMIAPEYSSTDTYNVDDYVVQSDKLYKCISAIESAEEWTPAHWTQVSFSEEVSGLNSAFQPIKKEMYSGGTDMVGGSVEYAENEPYSYGLGSMRYFDSVATDDYQITSLKIRAYKRSGASYKFKIVAIAFEATFVYVRGLSEEITLDEPTGSYEDYQIVLDNPFNVLAGQRVGILASDANWWQYSNTGPVSYYNRTIDYNNVTIGYRVMTFLPTPVSGDIPVVFYGGEGKVKKIIEIDDTLTKSGYAADAKVVGDTLTSIQDNISTYTLLISDINTNQSEWQMGVWDVNSTILIRDNKRYISYNGYLDNVDVIYNKDTDKYKYGLVAHDLSQTYPGKGWYNPQTETFTRGEYNYITDQLFDLSLIRIKYPNYKFTVSLRLNIEKDISTDQFNALGFETFHSSSSDYLEKVIAKTIFVASNGNDTNNGKDNNHPVKTINHALEIGATRIFIAGGNYSEQIDLSKSRIGVVSIAALDPNNSPIIYAPNSKITETENKVNGYTKIYSATTQHAFPQSTSLIFQEGIADVTTQITNSDRHPLQRGNFYRCADTAIYRCTATTLDNALTEIESSEKYKWYFDNGTIYFSRPETVSATHPLMTGLYDTPLFINSGNRQRIELSGLVIKYARVNLDGCADVKMTDCKVFGGCGAGIHYNGSLNIVLQRCDVARAYSGGLGDGIAATGDSSYGWAYGTTLTMIDCWAHDNNDDGFSDHVGCESTIIGGLYEHNTKGGLIPTGGGSCTCYNVTSRNNAIGFEIAGASGPVASGRNGQQIECHGCIAQDNSQYGFFTAGNQDMTMKLYNCMAINNGTGYAGPNGATGSELIAIDCKGYGNTTQKWGGITVVTCEPVT